MTPPWKCPTCSYNNPEGNYSCNNPKDCSVVYADISKGEKKSSLRLSNNTFVGIFVVGAILALVYWVVQQNGKSPVQVKSPEPIVTPTNTPTNTPIGTSTSSPTLTPLRQPDKTLASVPNVPEGLFYYGGSTTFAPLRNEAIVRELLRDHPKFNLTYKAPILDEPGSGTGIDMLIKGQISFSESSRSVKTEEVENAKAKGFTLKQEVIGYDSIAFYVHPDLSDPVLKGLTIEQLKGIFTSKITNWRDVNEPDLEITTFSRPPKAGGTVDYIQEFVMKGEDFGSNVQKVENTTWSIRRVSSTPGAIGYATSSEVIQQPIRVIPIAGDANKPFVPPIIQDTSKQQVVNKVVIANGSYPITRQIYVVIKQDGGRDQQAGEAYKNLLLSDEGQQLVDRAGFVPLR